MCRCYTYALHNSIVGYVGSILPAVLFGAFAVGAVAATLVHHSGLPLLAVCARNIHPAGIQNAQTSTAAAARCGLCSITRESQLHSARLVTEQQQPTAAAATTARVVPDVHMAEPAQAVMKSVSTTAVCSSSSHYCNAGVRCTSHCYILPQHTPGPSVLLHNCDTCCFW